MGRQKQATVNFKSKPNQEYVTINGVKRKNDAFKGNKTTKTAKESKLPQQYFSNYESDTIIIGKQKQIELDAIKNGQYGKFLSERIPSIKKDFEIIEEVVSFPEKDFRGNPKLDENDEQQYRTFNKLQFKDWKTGIPIQVHTPIHDNGETYKPWEQMWYVGQGEREFGAPEISISQTIDSDEYKTSFSVPSIGANVGEDVDKHMEQINNKYELFKRIDKLVRDKNTLDRDRDFFDKQNL